MKAELWSIEICSGPLEMAHGFKQKILEVYIPCFNISLNIAEDKINCFRTYEGRYSGNKRTTLVKEFDFPDHIAGAILAYIFSTEKFKDKFTGPIKKIFCDFKDTKLKREQKILKSNTTYTNVPKTMQYEYIETPKKQKKKS
jgi:hypothetical protein